MENKNNKGIPFTRVVGRTDGRTDGVSVHGVRLAELAKMVWKMLINIVDAHRVPACARVCVRVSAVCSAACSVSRFYAETID